MLKTLKVLKRGALFGLLSFSFVQAGICPPKPEEIREIIAETGEFKAKGGVTYMYFRPSKNEFTTKKIVENKKPFFQSSQESLYEKIETTVLEEEIAGFSVLFEYRAMSPSYNKTYTETKFYIFAKRDKGEGAKEKFCDLSKETGNGESENNSFVKDTPLKSPSDDKKNKNNKSLKFAIESNKKLLESQEKNMKKYREDETKKADKKFHDDWEKTYSKYC